MALVHSKVGVRSLFLILLAINIALQDMLAPTEARTLKEIEVLQGDKKTVEFVKDQMTTEAMKVGRPSPKKNNYPMDATKDAGPSPGIGH